MARIKCFREFLKLSSFQEPFETTLLGHGPCLQGAPCLHKISYRPWLTVKAQISKTKQQHPPNPVDLNSQPQAFRFLPMKLAGSGSTRLLVQTASPN